MKKLIPILLAVFALASCEKDPDMGKLDDNYLVYTNHDAEVWSSIPRFRLLPIPMLWQLKMRDRKSVV